MRVSGGLTEDGIVVGNAYDKYNTRNPIARYLMQGFEEALTELVGQVRPKAIHEVGCGEGYWTLKWREQGIAARGSDFSHAAIDLARGNARERDVAADIFRVGNVYDLQAERDTSELVVCCEVLEHLDRPDAGLQALQRVAQPHLIISVPREPIWSLMNMARGKYLRDFGNTPGHLQRWSRSAFVDLVSRYFDVIAVRNPLPWTMLLCRNKFSR